MSWAEVAGSLVWWEKEPVQPSMGKTTGKGCSGSTKDTCSTGTALTRPWIVAKSYVPWGLLVPHRVFEKGIAPGVKLRTSIRQSAQFIHGGFWVFRCHFIFDIFAISFFYCFETLSSRTESW
jgi:hypothetical protein